jgi:hypothetical protein
VRRPNRQHAMANCYVSNATQSAAK